MPLGRAGTCSPLCVPSLTPSPLPLCYLAGTCGLWILGPLPKQRQASLPLILLFAGCLAGQTCAHLPLPSLAGLWT